MKMNKETIKAKLRELQENEEYELIEETVTALPDSLIDDDILNMLCSAYFNLEEYKKAIALLEGQRERLDDDYKWNFRMGLALYKASEDEECEDNDELKKRILERAQVSFARSMNMNPPEDFLEAADMYMEKIELALDEIYGDSVEEEIAPEMYSEEEIDAIEEHIKEYFGDFPTVFHELVSPDIHCDIYIVPPTEEKNYYTLITVGMGAHIMDVPEELDAGELGRAELLICLPAEWKVGENAEEWFWPISLLKGLARLPINCETWLGWGHTVDHRETFAENTELCGSLLIYPENVEKGADRCTLPSGETVNFFEVIPLYREEMMFKRDHDTHALLEKMNEVSHIIKTDRENVCEGYYKQGLIDSSAEHTSKIIEKKLPLDAINGCNHIAAYLRWCIEHDLCDPELEEIYPDIVGGVKSGEQTDLRRFINNCLGGELSINQFNFSGCIFTRDYYHQSSDEAEFSYPRDVDDCAEKYFGTERYNSDEFKDEAYLFEPFDEDYYKRISKYIERAYADFYADFSEYQYGELLQTVKTAEEILGCECVFPKDPTDIVQEWKKALSQCEGEDLFPLVLVLDDSAEEINKEELEWILKCGADRFCQPIVIAKTPKDFLSRFEECEPSVLNSDEIELRSARLERIFGVKPAVFEIFEKGSLLMLPRKEGGYTLLKGD